MIISHTHKFIFIKSWKTAGTSIEAALSEYCSGEDIVTPLGDYDFNRSGEGEWIHKSLNAGDFKQHDYAQTIKDKLPPEIWQTYFKFSIARNPWDRAVSFFFWEKRRDPLSRPGSASTIIWASPTTTSAKSKNNSPDTSKANG